MQNPEDKIFQDLLSDYATPLEDAGFTESFMALVEEVDLRHRKLRRGLIFGACSIGGLISALQLPGLIDLIAGQDFSLGTLPISGFDQPSWTFGAILLVGFVLFCALDQKTSELF